MDEILYCTAFIIYLFLENGLGLFSQCLMCIFMQYLFFSIKTSQKFMNDYASRCDEEHYYATDDGGRAYDAVWVLALALNNTMAMYRSGDINGTGCENVSGSLVPLENFTYTNGKMGCLIQWNIQQTNISGVTVSHCDC